jgi:hypothetical protein
MDTVLFKFMTGGLFYLPKQILNDGWESMEEYEKYMLWKKRNSWLKDTKSFVEYIAFLKPLD